MAGNLADAEQLLKRLTTKDGEVFNFAADQAGSLTKLIDHAVARRIPVDTRIRILTGVSRDGTTVHASDSMTLLVWVCHWRLLERQFGWGGGSPEVIRRLLAAGARPNLQPETGGNALYFAVKFGNVEAVEALLEAGADPAVRDPFGRPVLYSAVERPLKGVVARLLEANPGCANERFMMGPAERGGKRTWEGQIGMVNAAEAMALVNPNAQVLHAWMMFGEPDIEVTVEAFKLLRRAGANMENSAARKHIKLNLKPRSASDKRKLKKLRPDDLAAIEQAESNGVITELRTAIAKVTGISARFLWRSLPRSLLVCRRSQPHTAATK